MKKTLLFVILTAFYLQITEAQKRNLQKPSLICHCKILDTILYQSVKQYVERNFKYHDNGIVIVKVPDNNYDKSNYGFILSEILQKHSLKTAAVPSAFFKLQNRFILIYGHYDNGCKKEKYYTYYSYFNRALREDDNETIDKHGIHYVSVSTFDPEIIQIFIKNGKVDFTKHMSKQLDITSNL